MKHLTVLLKDSEKVYLKSIHRQNLNYPLFYICSSVTIVNTSGQSIIICNIIFLYIYQGIYFHSTFTGIFLSLVQRCHTMAVSQAEIQSVGASKNPKLKAVSDVEIDKSGKFKYILIKVHDPDKEREFKHIVRGTAKAGYHGKSLSSLETSSFENIIH